LKGDPIRVGFPSHFRFQPLSMLVLRFADMKALIVSGLLV